MELIIVMIALAVAAVLLWYNRSSRVSEASELYFTIVDNINIGRTDEQIQNLLVNRYGFHPESSTVILQSVRNQENMDDDILLFIQNEIDNRK